MTRLTTFLARCRRAAVAPLLFLACAAAWAQAPVITQQPQSQTVSVGQTATFTVAATGASSNGYLTYQWHQKVVGGSFAAIVGANLPTYTTPAATTAMNGYQYRVVVRDWGAQGIATTSTAATLTVTSALQVPVINYSPSTATFTVGTAITAMTPSNSGGAAASWAISPALPAGLAFSTGTGQISGTPTAAQAATTYTVTATNATGSGNTTVTLTVLVPAPAIGYSPSTATFNVGTAIATMTPSNSGGAAASWAISPALSAGLAFSTSTGQISGTPTAAQAATTYTVTATNATGSGNTTVTLTINAALQAPVISYNPSSATFTVGTAIAAMTPSNSGGAAASWAISPALPAGLAFSTSTGQISGTPTAAQAATTYTVTATNATGSGNATVNLTILVPAPVISYSPSTATFTVGTAIAAMTPSNSGGAAASWAISPALSAGLAFSTSTGQISGTPTAAQAATSYTVTATNATGSGNATVNLTINAALQAPVIGYSPSTATFTVGTAIAAMTPSNSGGAAASWAISPALPAGLAFSTSTGQISGTPTAAQAATTYTVTATNASGSGNATVNLTILVPAPVIGYSPNTATFNVGTAIATMTPSNSGGAAASWSISPALPAGLAFSTSTGQISGTPTAAQAATTYTVTATNATGSGATTISLTVSAGPPAPSIGYYPNNADLNVGVTMTPLNPTNMGGAASSWAISPALPAGITLNASTGVISGLPASASPLTGYTVTATNATGSSNATVTISVSATQLRPAISYSPSTVTVYVGVASTPMVPTNTGGVATTWSISPTLPGGLYINPSTGQISGTPIAAKVATNYLVTASNGAGSGTATVRITASSATPPPAITYSGSPATFTVGTAITALLPTNSGGAATSFSITPALSSGLVFTTSTGRISGTPTVAKALTVYTVTATNATGSGNTTVSITVGSGLPAPAISYNPSAPTFTVGVAIPAMTPTNSGGAATSWGVSPALPGGLAISTSTGQITGTPTAAQSGTVYTVTATNATGSGTTTVNLTINAALQAPVISYSASPASFTVGSAIPAMTPTNTGGAATGWSIAPALPAGLSFQTGNGVITGTPSAALAQASFTVSATNAAGTGNTVISITIDEAGQAPAIAPAGQPVSQTVTALATATFTVTATGTAPLSYQWFKNNTAIPGATSASWTTPSTSAADNGSTYYAQVTNPYGSLNSSQATLTVNQTTLGALQWKRDIVYLGTKEVAEVGLFNAVTVTLTDHLGSPRFVVEPSGNVIEQKFMPFGESLLSTLDQGRIAKGYTNHEQTDPSGLIYMQGRFYGPMYHRFLSPDPARDQYFEQSQSWNIYSYVQNNPISKIDPSGLFFEELRNWWTGGGWNKNKEAEKVRVVRTVEANRNPDVPEHLRAPERYIDYNKAGEIVAIRDVRGLRDDSASLLLLAGGANLAKNLVKAGGKALIKKGGSAAAQATTAAEERTVIGRVKDLQNLQPGERSMLDRLPNMGSPKANWQQNAGVLRQEMSRGLPIRDASVGDTSGQFLNAERNLLRDHGWTFDSGTSLWKPPVN